MRPLEEVPEDHALVQAELARLVGIWPTRVHPIWPTRVHPI